MTGPEGIFDGDAVYDTAGTVDDRQPSTSDTPDPFNPANDPAYQPAGAGPDVPFEYLPPWSQIRAPGTEQPIVAGDIVPIDPWQPVVALLNGDQLARLNRESAARQAAAYFTVTERNI